MAPVVVGNDRLQLSTIKVENGLTPVMTWVFVLLKPISSFDDDDDNDEEASVAVIVDDDDDDDDDDDKVFWMIVGRGTMLISPNGRKKNRNIEK